MPPYGDNPSAPPMDSGAESPTAPEQPSGDAETFFLPPTDAPWAKGLNKGDEITFRVVDVDKDGNVELTYATGKGEGEGDEGNFTDGLEEHMNEPANPGSY